MIIIDNIDQLRAVVSLINIQNNCLYGVRMESFYSFTVSDTFLFGHHHDLGHAN